MKPTVAHLLPGYNPFPPRYPAGTELRVEQVARRQQRYRPLVICGWFAGQLESDNADSMCVRRIRFGRAYRRLFQKITRIDPVPYVERMWRIIEAEDASLLHLHNEPKLLSGLYSRLRRDSRPVIVHVANEKPLPEVALDRVTRWVACSQYIADWLVRANGIPAQKVEVIYTGVDSTNCRPQWEVSDTKRRALRQKYGVAREESVVLVFAGRLVKEKGVIELLNAFDRLRTTHGEGVELLIAGNVRDSDDPKNGKASYGRAVLARIERTPGARWIGSLPPNDVHEFLLAGDIFVMPSLWHDPFPTAMLEAAAAGLPIVAAARGGITEFLTGCPGFDSTMQPENAESLAAAIEGYMGDAVLRLASAHWLRGRVERNFDWSRVCGEFEDLYDRLLIAGPSH